MDYKTSHQLARELLEGPDRPIFIYTKPDEDNQAEGHAPRLANVKTAFGPVIELYGLEPHAS